MLISLEDLREGHYRRAAKLLKETVDSLKQAVEFCPKAEDMVVVVVVFFSPPHILDFCGLVGSPHLTAKKRNFAPLPTSTKESRRVQGPYVGFERLRGFRAGRREDANKKGVEFGARFAVFF